MRLTAINLIAALALLCAGVGYAAIRSGGGGGGPTASTAAHKKPRFNMRGSAEGLVPGRTSRLSVRIRNRTRSQVRIRKIKVRVLDASPACAGANLSIGLRKLRVRIPPKGLRWTWVPVTLRAAAPDACQNATFPLRFKAKSKAKPAGRP